MILGILQARTSSSRLPGKILKPILDRPLIMHQIDRLQRIRNMDHLVLATSNDSSDDSLADLCRENGIDCYRGDLDDVLKRFHGAAQGHNADHIIRLTGDCPLIDPDVVDQIIDFYLTNNYDYATNAVEPTYPDGLDAEIFSYACLEQDYINASLQSEREHVTPWIRKQPHYKIGHFKGPHDWSALRWTVDEPADFELVTMIYERLYPQNPHFTTGDILAYLEERPELKTWNTQYERNEGLKKSESQDKIVSS